MSSDANFASAQRLMAAAGMAPPAEIVRLAGGKNNRVFLIEARDGTRCVMKEYFHDRADPRDRLSAEWSFLEYAIARGVACTPKPLARYTEARCALFTHVAGRRPAAAELSAAHMEAAADFVSAVNGPPKQPFALQPGSEACFSLADHVSTIERRVARLLRLDRDSPLAEAAAAFVERSLVPCWARIRARIGDAADDLGGELAPERMCISPSDFGFHNSLVDGDSIMFIDFEYAGRDDPAKLICDFFNQPEVPVPPASFDGFLHAISGPLGLTAADHARCRLLLDAYRIKWVCIMLNDFLPIDAARRAFASAGDRDERRRQQLEKAEASLARLAACAV